MKISKKNGGKRFYRFRITFFRHCPSISTSADNDSYREQTEVVIQEPKQNQEVQTTRHIIEDLL